MHLYIGHVVAAQIWAGQIQEALAGMPTGLYQTRPRGGVYHAGYRQAAGTLEGLNGDHRAVGVRAELVNEGGVTGVKQPIMQLAYTTARGATLQVVEVQGLN
jgi:hypothetical protein